MVCVDPYLIIAYLCAHHLLILHVQKLDFKYPEAPCQQRLIEIWAWDIISSIIVGGMLLLIHAIA